MVQRKIATVSQDLQLYYCTGQDTKKDLLTSNNTDSNPAPDKTCDPALHSNCYNKSYSVQSQTGMNGGQRPERHLLSRIKWTARSTQRTQEQPPTAVLAHHAAYSRPHTKEFSGAIITGVYSMAVQPSLRVLRRPQWSMRSWPYSGRQVVRARTSSWQPVSSQRRSRCTNLRDADDGKC